MDPLQQRLADIPNDRAGTLHNICHHMEIVWLSAMQKSVY